jgi:hypothetical protein
MAFQREQKKTFIGNDRVRIRVVLTGDACVSGTQEATILYWMMMRQIADEPHLLQCGYSHPQRVHIHHNGSAWQVEAEAEIEERP